MTSLSTIQFISQVKLGELRDQRALLLAAYGELTESCDGASPVQALKILFEGLQEIEVADKPLHPDMGNFELLLDGTAPSDEIVQFWRQKLDAEVVAGRLRADIVYLFGALLGEWGDNERSRQTFLEQRRQAHDNMLQNASTPASAPQAQSLMDELLENIGYRLRDISDGIDQQITERLESGDGASVDLYAIATNIYLPADVRREARRFRDDQVLYTQFHDAIRIITRDLRSWTWPSDGVATRAVWTRNKWRLYPNLSLIQLSILSSFGQLWSAAIESQYSNPVGILNRRRRLQKLRELDAPAVIVDVERRMLAIEENRTDLGWYESVDPWDGAPVFPVDGKLDGLVTRRATEQMSLRESDRRPYYDGYGANQMVSLINAEIQTLRAAYPDRPLFVANLDIRDFFASVPHDLVVTMVKGLGLSSEDSDVIRGFLQVPLLIDGKIVPAQCGLPMDQDLSHWLAEWLMRLMERSVHRNAAVRIIRQVDDICLLAPTAKDLVAAWEAIEQFLEKCGLEINRDKCGACAFGADLPDELPNLAPRWGLLELTSSGDWQVNEASFQMVCTTTRDQIRAKDAILAKVMTYNAYLRYLTSAVGLSTDLGDVHRKSTNDALQRFEGELFDDNTGIVDELRSEIRDRHLKDMELDLPESWMYWPVTAGGLGLRSATILAGQHQMAFDDRRSKRIPPPKIRSVDWQLENPDWLAFYNSHFEAIVPAAPKESRVMKALVDDFIARGQEISAGKQETLSDYWRWVLSIYGPQILEKLGTFRFLLTDLVPLQLIHEQLLTSSSIDE